MRVNFTGVVAGEASAGLPKRAEDRAKLKLNEDSKLT